MKHTARELSLKECINSFQCLDCRSLPGHVNGNASTVVIQRPKIGKVASIATIRALLVFFGTLRSHLQMIVNLEDLSKFYEGRKPLIEKVIPDSVFAFEFCRSVLAMKGATDTPIATKLALIANDVGDLIDLLKARVGISMEYHELKYNVIGDIRDFLTNKEFSMADVDPLMYSLTVSLPSRLECFANNASGHHTSSVDELFSLTSEVTQQASMKINELKSREAAQSDQLNPPILELIKEKSPFRPKLEVLRGVKVRQPLKHIHKRVPSLRDSETVKDSRHLVSDQNKENDMLHNREKAGSQIPVVSMENKSTEQGFHSRLNLPSKVENRKLVNPLNRSRRSSVDCSDFESSTSSQAPTPLTSKISRPTTIRSLRSHAQLNVPLSSISTPKRSCFSSRHLSAFAKRRYDLRLSSPDYPSPKMQLVSSGSAFEETPLTRKQTSGHSGQPFTSPLPHSALHVHRARQFKNSRL